MMIEEIKETLGVRFGHCTNAALISSSIRTFLCVLQQVLTIATQPGFTEPVILVSTSLIGMEFQALPLEKVMDVLIQWPTVPHTGRCYSARMGLMNHWRCQLLLAKWSLEVRVRSVCGLGCAQHADMQVLLSSMPSIPAPYNQLVVYVPNQSRVKDLQSYPAFKAAA